MAESPFDGKRSSAASQGGEIAAQRVFGPQAGVYAASPVHAGDPSLDALRAMASPDPGVVYDWALDLGTGAGFTAFAMAGLSLQVMAIDPTLAMLQQARRIGLERKLANLAMVRSLADALPVAAASMDLVASRMAPHHFNDFEGTLDEVRRVLKPGGCLLMADSIAPAQAGVAEWMNRIEMRRDFSHVENRQETKIEELVTARGMILSHKEHTRIGLMFNDWAARTATSEAETQSLRRDFLNAGGAVREAFEIRPQDGDISFSWPCLIFRAVKA